MKIEMARRDVGRDGVVMGVGWGVREGKETKERR